MATPAAAALLAKALPRPTSAPNAGGSTSGERGRTGTRGRGRGRGGAAGAGRGRDEDVGMSDVSDNNERGGAQRTGRRGRLTSGPMGERPTRSKTHHNAPAVIPTGPKASTSTSTSGSAALETLRLFLTSRYNAEHQLLNLENMASDTILITAGVKAPGEKGAPQSLSGAMWKLAGELFPDTVSISLANNNLTTLLPLSPFYLTTFLPKIRNFSLASNALSSYSDLNPFSPIVGPPRGDNKEKGWKHLTELVLLDNPMVSSAGITQFQSEMARRFPTLQSLNQQPFNPATVVIAKPTPSASMPGLSPAAKRAQAKEQSKRAPVVFPVEVKGGFAENDGARDFVGGFFAKFFPAFDTDRPSLISAYSQRCTFSYFMDTVPPARSKARRIGANGDKAFPNQQKLLYKEIVGGSRNLERIGNTGAGATKRIELLRTNSEDVIKALVEFPKTVHPLSDPEKFVFDTWTMPGLLAPTVPGTEGATVIYAVVHGQFMELPSKGVRSFSRTFILAPSPPGSPAQAAGWPCVILSDIFALRGYTDPSAWAPPKTPAPAASGSAAAPPTAAMPVQERAEGLTDAQQAIILELQAHTRLTYAFAHLCLTQNGWEPAAALANFQALQAAGTIPPEAFIQ